MTTIDRLRYYDGEFLRAFDFGDEQTYHMEMRRRMNRYLHRYGIVQGLQLSEDVQAGVHEVSILPGLAIDAFGREIYVFVPDTLGDQDITNNRIPAGGGLYDVWLRYNKTPQTPPSSGYNNCNQTNEYTRWMENFTVVLLKSPSNPFTPPAFTDDDTDDPTQDQIGVLLGTVNVNPGSATLQFSNPVFHGRHFLGVIAQRIQTPPGYDATGSFNFKGKQSPRDPAVSLEIEPNIFAKQNLIVGPDFDLKTTPATSVPSVNTPGAVKIAGDLFVQGTLYSSIPNSSAVPEWVGIKDYVKQLVQQSQPDFVTTATPATVSVTPNAAQTIGGIFSDTVSITLTSNNLASISNVEATAAIGGIQFNNPVNPNGVELFISLVKGSLGPAANQCTVSVTYSVTPVPASLVSPIQSFYISAAAVCFP